MRQYAPFRRISRHNPCNHDLAALRGYRGYVPHEHIECPALGRPK